MLSSLRSVLTQGRSLLVAPHATLRWPTNHATPVELGTNQLGMQQRWATKKAGGSSSNRKDSAGRRLGWKKSNGQPVRTGHILIRQRGLKYHAGLNVGVGTDHTLFAEQPGQVYYTRITRSWKKLRRKDRVYVNVVPAAYFHDPLYRYVRLAVDTYFEKIQADKLLAYRMRKNGVKLLSKTRLQVVAKRQANETVQRKIREANPVRLSASDAIRMIMATDTPQ